MGLFGLSGLSATINKPNTLNAPSQLASYKSVRIDLQIVQRGKYQQRPNERSMLILMLSVV